MLLIQRHLGFGLSATGREFSKNHATVINANGRLGAIIEANGIVNWMHGVDERHGNLRPIITHLEGQLGLMDSAES